MFMETCKARFDLLDDVRSARELLLFYPVLGRGSWDFKIWKQIDVPGASYLLFHDFRVASIICR